KRRWGHLMRWLNIVLASLVAAADIWGGAGEWYWFLHGYPGDIALAVLTYFVVQEGFEPEGGWPPAVLTLVISSVWQFAQVCLESQTFDPWDFVAYAAGASIALLLAAITPRQPADVTHSDADPDE